MGRVIWLAVAPIWLAPLLGGVADRPYTLLLAAAGALACLAATLRQPLRLSWFHLWLGTALLATLLQVVPLPPSLRAAVAAGSDADLRAIVAGLEGAGRWWPLSSDVGATLHEAVRLAGYLGLLAALGAATQPARAGQDGAGAVRGAILGSAALCAGLGVLAGLGVALPAPIAVPGGGATRALFPAGLYNSNHMAALVGLGALLALDAAQGHAAARVRLALLGVAALCDVVLVGTLSRAGIVVWLAAQLVLLAGSTRSGGRLRRLGPLLALALALLLLGFLWLGESTFVALKSRFADSDLPSLTAAGGKLHAWLDAWPLLRGHWLLGVGRGAFENAFQHMQPLAGRMRFAYLENEWLQAIVDWGLPTALALSGLLFLALRDSWQQPARRGSKVALLGLAGLAVHNLFDFNLEVGGVAVAALGLVALCQKQRFAVPRWLAVGLAAATLALTLLVALRFPSHDEDGAQLRRICGDPAATVDQIAAAGSAAVLRHPLDSYLSALVAARLTAEQRPDQRQRAQAEASSWVNRALLANPHDVLAQHSGARLLIERGYRTQGLLLLGAALRDADDPQRLWLLRSLAGWVQDADEVFAVLPAPAMAVELLEQLVTSPSPPWPLVQAVGERAVQLRLPGAAVWLGRAALALHASGSAQSAARTLLDEPGELPGRLLADLIDLLGQAGQAAEAEALVRRALGRSERAELLLAGAQLSEKREASDEARQLLERALTRSQDPGLSAHIHDVYGDLEARAGNVHRAAAHRLEAARLRSSP